MPRSSIKVCRQPGCPELRPCPVAGHEPQWTDRRARIGNVSGWQQQRDAQRIIRKHHGICHVCGLAGATQVDHVTPLFEGGAHSDENLRPVHAEPCHRDKTTAEAARARRRGPAA